MNRSITQWAVVVVWLAALRLGLCATYYVAPSGEDTGPGTRARPWRTLEKVNRTVVAGDTVVLLAGDHVGALAPEHGGLEGRPLTFRGEPAQQARLRDGNPVIELKGKHHIALEGLVVEPRRGRFLTAEDCKHLTIRNCRFERSSGGWTGLALKNCEDVRFLKSVCRRNLQPNPKHLHFGGHAFDATRCKRLIIEDSVIGEGGHGGASITFTEQLVVRRTVFCAGWGRALSIYRYCRPVLFEQNLITGAFDSGGSAGPGSATTPSDCIWRYNLVARNWGNPVGSGVWTKGKRPVSEVRHNRFYHNTFAYNLEGAFRAVAFGTNNIASFEDNTWKNNIFYMNDYTGCFSTFSITGVRLERMLVHNAICGDVPGRKLFTIWDAAKKRERAYTLSEAEQAHGDMFSGNRELVPRFVDADKDDFRLAPGSPCVDAGVHLARATSGGSGTELGLDDARWFYDGFGIPGEQGDLVFVGARKKGARVVRVDRESNVLVLDRALKWEKGAGVSLPYAGKAPDFGAFEHGAEREPWYRRVTVPPGIYWTPPEDPRAPLLVSDFETASREQWGMLWNIDRKRGTEHERVKEEASGGSYCLRTYATGNRATMAVDVEPWLWEIDRYPYVKFRYRIPAGTPVGIWLRTFNTNDSFGPWSQPRVCIGGSAAALDKIDGPVKAHKLIDDDTWHTITIDARLIRKVYLGLKYLRAFDFRNSKGKRDGLGKKDDQFWFDDFAILPE